MKYNHLKTIIKATLLENLTELTDKQKIDSIMTVYSSGSKTGRIFRDLSYEAKLSKIQFAKDLYEKNKESIDRMFRGATVVEYLGGGSYGDAFDLGDKVLKIEIDKPDSKFDAAKRSETSASSLFSKIKKNQKLGKYFPMIYDQGSFSYPSQPNAENFNWTIMEKFEQISGLEKDELDILLDTITDKLFNNSESFEHLLDIQNYSRDDQKFIQKLGPSLRLKKNWFKDLIKGIYQLYKTYDLTDFHAGNVGIRRSGAEGSLVFFD